MVARSFYRQLGFTELLFESVEFFDPMAPLVSGAWYDRIPPGPA
jgi:hypothetical protein